MRHTPGPWIRSKHGFNVLTNDSMQSIAAVHAIHPGHSSDKDSEEQIANAQLIAAAPELLEACKAALAFTMGSHDASVDLDLLLSRAIAKAEGGS